MAKLLYRLGRWCYRAKWIVIVVWVLMLAAIGGSAFAFQGGYNDIFTINGTQAQKATHLLLKNFPGTKSPIESTGVTIAFKAPAGEKLEDPDNSAAIDQVIGHIENNLEGLTDTQRFGNPVKISPELQRFVFDTATSQGLPEEVAKKDADNLSLISPEGNIGFTTFSIDVPIPADVTKQQREVIADAMDLGRAAGLEVEAGGPAYGDPIVIEETSEIIGLAVAAIILVLTFGSMVAAGLPLITAVISVAIGSLSVTLATAWVPLNNITPVLAVMLGLAVGVDYALFILFRYRHELSRMGREEAAGMAVGTAGSAVVFAGLTVIIALVALVVADIAFLTYMGMAAAFTVFIAVVIALTLLPAILGVLGHRVFKGEIKAITHRSRTNPMGERWVKLIHKAPALVIAIVVFGLGALTIPAGQLHLSLPSDGQSPKETTQRKMADILYEGFGPGADAQFLVVVDAHDVNPDSKALEPLIRAQQPLDPAAEFDRNKAAAFASYMHVVQKFSATQDVRHVQLIGVSDDGYAAQMLLTTDKANIDPATNQLISALRIKEKEVTAATGVDSGITGLVPVQQDVVNRLSNAMPLYLSIVVGLAIVLLLIIFRSVLVPIIAGVGFLLSVGAAFGVTVLFWQQGLWGVVGTPAPIIAFLPIFLIGVCFGLAMDYQVFLVSAMREHYTHSGSQGEGKYNGTEASVIHGFAKGARVVTAAALIMIAVFIAFIGQPIPFIKIFGFALGAGVFFDAFLVRMAFVPAAMFLTGHATWWMPKWLDKILPRLDVEGAKLEEEFARNHPELVKPRVIHTEPVRAASAKKIGAVFTQDSDSGLH
ncbi:putative RND superfamily drug exporter [Corynebacterium mustelae]|uniref:Putative RND superfamily drug exporter n=1 Tax=Corynebacterium mustelae TaxID=571915 RepID=A0A0G3GTJ1_9CORY|nr:MMPL family transporter [Corynebacterium mustelae]AKK04501.1 putative RND superfamily drug exporter [Corynebacterium mustelae]